MRAALTKLTIPLVLLSVSLALSQEDIVDRTPLGKRASPFLNGGKATGVVPEFLLFSKMGFGYQSNVYRSPYHFDASGGGEATRQFPTQINLPRSDFPGYASLGGEVSMLPGPRQFLRLIGATQTYRFLEESQRDVSTVNGFGAYRWDPSSRLRLDVQGQLDLIKGKSALIFGTPNYLTWDEYLNGEGSVELSAYTIPATVIGRGRTQAMGQVRYRDYGEPVRTVTTRPGVLYVPGYDDSLELDYAQYRGRLRHTQGLVRGFSAVLSGDYIYRSYFYQRAKMTVDGYMGDPPVDTATNLPTGPLRKEFQSRLYAGMRFDAPHVKRLRLNAGVEHIANRDPFQGFYSYDQVALRMGATYQPSDIGHTEFTLATKVREYKKLKANLGLAFGFPPPRISGGDTIAPGDTSWKKTGLETNMIEARWRGQLPLARVLALWGQYQLDVRVSNRLAFEMQSREYFDQRISGGLILYYRSDAW